MGGVLLAGSLAAGLLPPATWSAWTAAHPSGSSLPTGGPAVTGIRDMGGGFGAGTGPGPGGQFGDGAPPGRFGGGFGGGFAAGGPGPGLAGGSSPSQAEIDWLVAQRGSATWIAAAASAGQAGPIIIATGLPVIALGGFNGDDPAIDVAGFRTLIAAGKVRYVLAGDGGLGGGRAGGGGPGGGNAVVQWAAGACSPVDGFSGLYDCANAGAETGGRGRGLETVPGPPGAAGSPRGGTRLAGGTAGAGLRAARGTRTAGVQWRVPAPGPARTGRCAAPIGGDAWSRRGPAAREREPRCRQASLNRRQTEVPANKQPALAYAA
jgi:hypothetical protein